LQIHPAVDEHDRIGEVCLSDDHAQYIEYADCVNKELVSRALHNYTPLLNLGIILPIDWLVLVYALVFDNVWYFVDLRQVIYLIHFLILWIDLFGDVEQRSIEFMTVVA
jgi:hypothetical protein